MSPIASNILTAILSIFGAFICWMVAHRFFAGADDTIRLVVEFVAAIAPLAAGTGYYFRPRN